jgi:hypothetical protein
MVIDWNAGQVYETGLGLAWLGVPASSATGGGDRTRRGPTFRWRTEPVETLRRAPTIYRERVRVEFGCATARVRGRVVREAKPLAELPSPEPRVYQAQARVRVDDFTFRVLAGFGSRRRDIRRKVEDELFVECEAMEVDFADVLVVCERLIRRYVDFVIREQEDQK